MCITVLYYSTQRLYGLRMLNHNIEVMSFVMSQVCLIIIRQS